MFECYEPSPCAELCLVPCTDAGSLDEVNKKLARIEQLQLQSMSSTRHASAITADDLSLVRAAWWNGTHHPVLLPDKSAAEFATTAVCCRPVHALGRWIRHMQAHMPVAAYAWPVVSLSQLNQ